MPPPPRGLPSCAVDPCPNRYPAKGVVLSSPLFSLVSSLLKFSWHPPPFPMGFLLPSATASLSQSISSGFKHLVFPFFSPLRSLLQRSLLRAPIGFRSSDRPEGLIRFRMVRCLLTLFLLRFAGPVRPGFPSPPCRFFDKLYAGQFRNDESSVFYPR